MLIAQHEIAQQRNQLFSQAKRSKREVDLIKYRRMRNRVLSQLRTAKANYLRCINSRDAKQFWKAVKYLNKAQSSIPVLKMDEVSVHSDVEKADMTSEYFTTCFNQNIPPLDPGVPEDLDEGYASTEEFLCTTEEVFHLLVSLDTSKSSGPDGISACMLKLTAGSIAPSVTTMFNLSLKIGCMPVGWKVIGCTHSKEHTS